MDRQEFWKVIEDARLRAGGDVYAVADHAVEILVALSPEEIVRAAQPFWDLMADSYREDLWGAAYLINGGASDDGFEYFRGWLIAEGREVFERAVAAPDTLATVPAVRAAAAQQEELECEEMLGIVWNAHLKVTGRELPQGAFTIRYPAVGFSWDFEDRAQTRSHLPRLSELYLD
ncbi:MAG TPA: DUF4240 domain-containing protein [Actinoallomurus sp.]|jgi:hypothetical protein|nr:DUF4240 domain-containing protein [Actinoallomurus sp.]